MLEIKYIHLVRVCLLKIQSFTLMSHPAHPCPKFAQIMGIKGAFYGEVLLDTYPLFCDF
jgi:hypothetical protein